MGSTDSANDNHADLPISQTSTKLVGQACSNSVSESYKTLLVTRNNGIWNITMNRPQKRNAISFEMYDELTHALQTAAADETCCAAVLTGAGEYYCSGNDQANFTNAQTSVPDGGAGKFKNFITALIDFPKPLIALVNGPAVGAAVTTLALFDAVYASDKATFVTPFTRLALSPEGCSSYLFPRLMGPGRASEMLLFNKKITAHEARERNLVTEVIPDHAFKTETDAKMEALAKLPKASLKASKVLIRNAERQKLHETNEAEYSTLVKVLQSEEAITVALNFMKRKRSKL